MAEATLELREEANVGLERYSIVLVDIETGQLLDYTRSGGLDPREAYRIAMEIYGGLASCGGDILPDIGGIIEADFVGEYGYAKIIIDREAGLLRALISKAS
ncbi:MAG: hypothetical protein LRS46_03420 [Desulfurococcales archaeon]|nr:hypothetical protein [Desulfurococcales archaeon]